MKRYGRGCIEFTKITVVVLNQVLRPFTSRWHRKSLAGAFDSSEECAAFRAELAEIQQVLHTYAMMLAEMAGVKDITNLEAAED